MTMYFKNKVVRSNPIIYFKLYNGAEIQKCFVNSEQYSDFEDYLADKIKESIKEYDSRVNFVSIYNDYTIEIHFNFQDNWNLETLRNEVSKVAKQIVEITARELSLIKIPNEYLLFYKEDFYVIYSGDNKVYDLLDCSIEYLEDDTLEDLECLF